MLPHSAQNDRILSYADVRERIPYTRQNIARLEKLNQFPKRIQYGAGRIGWSAQEIDAWIEAKKAERPEVA